MLLSHYPSLEALFFLDADNLLEAGALAVFERILDEKPEPDWFYPQFDMFGLRYNATNCGTYSLLLHSYDNMCEAGSLVRRRVFEAGVWFDELMRLGYEDWDFWLSAAKLGFRGEPIEEPVFLYRKRPESMLSGSHRFDAEIRSFLHRKHAWLYNPKTVLALEEREAPRYRILFDDGTIMATTDPLGPGRAMAAEEFIREVWAWIASNGETGAGSVWVASTRAAWQSLAAHGLLRFALWDLERRLWGVNVSTCILGIGDQDGFALDDAAGLTAPHLRAGLAAMDADLVDAVLRDQSDAWIKGVVEANPPQTFSHRTLRLPRSSPAFSAGGGAVGILLSTVLEARRHAAARSALRTGRWRTRCFPSASRMADVARAAARTGVLYPRTYESDRPSVCFVLSIAEFGGVETVAANVALALRERGFGTALCVVGNRPIHLPPELLAGFDELLWYAEQARCGAERSWLPDDGD
ncbi:MAG: hypothetical protein RML45_01970 [Acetobacteraceae bacterium]|nr:hypothetical protein [Acetobacteraceae bacterium]